MIKPFDNISKKNLNKLFKKLNVDNLYFEENKYIPKNIIDNKTIGIILNGYIQVIRTNYNGNDIVVEELYENDIFSSSSLFIDSNEYELHVKEKINIILIDENLLLNFEDNSKSYYNQFIKNLYQILNDKMKLKNERIRIITKKSIRDKLLEYFYISRKKTGSTNIYLPYNYSALSDYLGVNRSALMREIKNLKTEGFIETKGKKIKLLY